ncbi:cytochrome c family protein [Methanolobus halotolerans]|uniref:Cytochrome c family protein n=2 Tax=Methanolobus halotolerans TaxID=2052935 RepID=A0A4E0QD53_9EURY|nr:cytochrome c family protein [Methanolobus halotolerans]
MLLLGCANAAEPTASGELSSSDFTGTDRCIQCHAIIHSQWDGTMHSNAYTDPFYLKEFETASQDTDGLIDSFCSRCHTPIGVVSGEIPPADGSRLSGIAKDGVQCDFCHTVSGSNGTGNAPFIVTPGDTKWGPFNDSRSAYHDSEYLDLHTKSEFCGMCHEVSHPVNGLLIDDTYPVWKNSTYAQEGVTCQDCHMTPGITEFEANPGRSGSGAPKRDHISLHSTVGGNAFVTGILGADDVKKMAIERLEKAATLDMSSPETAHTGEDVTVEVSITNSGAGHNIPTGVSEIRQIWLEVRVTDAGGREIYNAGRTDNKGGIISALKIYNNVLGDDQGDPTLSFWLADRVLSDNRIGPKETVSEEHTFFMPENTVYPVTVDAILKYRSAPQELIDHLFGEGVHEVPVIDMAEISNVIYDPGSPPGSRTESRSSPGFTIFIAVALLLIIYVLKNNKKGG